MNATSGKKPVVRKKVVNKAGDAAESERVFTPTAEAKSKATTLRILAIVAWVIAIGGEIATIFWVLKQDPIKLWLLVVAIVVMGVFALVGGQLWKKANRYDPASKKNKLKFWLWNNLGVIVTALAFIPLIVLILLNKDMDGKQKGIAAGLAAVIAVVVGLASYDWNPVSQEQYAHEQNIVEQLTGVNEVYWVKGGSVFHVCDAVPDVNKESKDGQIYTGTVADAHADGKDRLTLKWESEAVNYCGISQEKVDEVKAAVANDGTGVEDSDSTGDETDETTDEPTDESTTEDSTDESAVETTE